MKSAGRFDEDGATAGPTRDPDRRVRCLVSAHAARPRESDLAAAAGTGVPRLRRAADDARHLARSARHDLRVARCVCARCRLRVASWAISSASRPYTVRVFDPLLAGFYSVPAILLFPLYLLFFGLGPASKIAIGTTIAFFPVALNTIAGLSFVNRSYVTAARSMGASDLQLFSTVMLPAALPVVLTGFRLGGIIAFMTILGCEMIASLSGLGHRIVEAGENMEPSKMFAGIIFAVLLAVRHQRGRFVCRSARPAVGTMSAGNARLLVIAGLLVLWEVGARLFGDPLFICPPSAVVQALGPLFGDPKVVHAVAITVVRDGRGVRDRDRCRSVGGACGGAARLYQRRDHAGDSAAVRDSADDALAAVRVGLGHRARSEDRVRRQPGRLSRDRFDRRRRRKSAVRPGDRGALDGCEPAASPADRRAAAHGAVVSSPACGSA